MPIMCTLLTANDNAYNATDTVQPTSCVTLAVSCLSVSSLQRVTNVYS